MTLSATTPIRFGLHGALIAAMALILLALGPGRAMAADPGVVTVYGYQWSKEYKVQLRDLPGKEEAVNGQVVKVYGMKDVLDAAEAQPGDDFTVDSLSKIEIVFPGNKGKVTYSGNQIRSNADLPTFYVNDQNVTVMRVPGGGGRPGGEYAYTTLNPKLYEPKQGLKSFKVSVSPAKKTVKSGTKVTFTATLDGLAGGVLPTFVWSIVGVTQPSNGGSFTGTFKGKAGDSIAVVLQVSAPGYNSASGGAIVYIDKAPKKKPDKTKNKNSNGDQNNTEDQGYTDPGYYDPYDGYYDDYGSGTGGGSPATSSPSPSSPEPKEKQRREQPPVEPSGETVTGQLIDPTQIAEVVPTEDSPSGSSAEEASPDEADSGGGGIPGGVKTALGIGALLGIGGLAEAGAFSGALRRFRFRL